MNDYIQSESFAPTYIFKGIFEKLPSNCKPGDVATLKTDSKGGKTIYRNYICYEENVWTLLDDVVGEKNE